MSCLYLVFIVGQHGVLLCFRNMNAGLFVVELWEKYETFA